MENSLKAQCTQHSAYNIWYSEPLVISTLPYIADIVTPEEQEQVFAASVHNLSKLATILLKECTGTRN